MRTIWIASYPKSGNTWFRLLVENLAAAEKPFDINGPFRRSIHAAAREPFEHLLLLDSSLLTHDEIANLRPRVYETMARKANDPSAALLRTGGVRFVLVHDAYGPAPNGEPLLAGERGADGAILIVRDPRGVAPSLANHYRTSIDAAIASMNDGGRATHVRPDRLYPLFRHTLRSWSGHTQSWLEQTAIPVHLVRYEDMHADPAGTLRGALDFADEPATDQDIGRAVAFAGFEELRGQERASGFRQGPRRPGGPFFRRGEAGAWRNELTPAQIATVESAHGSMMRRLGYLAEAAPMETQRA
jgi:aryl sulfotransferase